MSIRTILLGMIVVRVVRVARPTTPPTNIICLGYLAFFWGNFRNYSVGWLLDLGLARPDSHLVLLKTKKRMRKMSFIAVPQR